MRLWYVWLVTGVILMLVEIATPGFFAASVGVGALAAALVSYLGGGLTLQIAVFSISTLAVFVLARPLLRRASVRFSDRRATNIDAPCQCRLYSSLCSQVHESRRHQMVSQCKQTLARHSGRVVEFRRVLRRLEQPGPEQRRLT